MMRTIWPVLSLALVLGLTGCVNVGSGTSPSRHYLIPSLADQGLEAPDKPTDGVRIALLPIAVAAYLDRPQLVIRQQGDRLELAEYDRWAAPPADNLRRVLKENLDLLTSRATITGFGAGYQLEIELQRLEGTGKGALLQLAWRLHKRSDSELVAQGRFRQLETVDGSSPARLVAGYGKAIEVFSREMATRLDLLATDRENGKN